MKLGDISPLAGMLTGKGATGKLIAQGFGGLLPAAIARSAQEDDEEEAERNRRAGSVGSVGTVTGQGMKKGGAVKAKGWGKARSARAAKVY